MGIVNGSIQIAKKDSTWFTANASEVLKDGQLVFNETTSELFIGDGVTVLSSLLPINGGGSQDLQQVTDLGATTTNQINTGGIEAIKTDGIYTSQVNTYSTESNLTYDDGSGNVSQVRASIGQAEVMASDSIELNAPSILRNGVEIATVNDIVNVDVNTIGSAINGADSATPNDTDLVMSVESSVAKKNTWTQIKAFLKTYFDTVYTTTSAVATQITTAISGKENTANKSDSYTVSSSTTYATTKALVDGLATKQASFTDVENTQTITGTSITLPNTPTFIYGVFKNGQRLTKTTDYTISTNIITLVDSADSDSFTITYKY